MPDSTPIHLIPEDQEGHFVELMDHLRTAWQESPDAPKQLLDVASMVLSGAPVLSDPQMRESALQNTQITHGVQAQMRLIGNMDAHADFTVGFRSAVGESDEFSLQRQAGNQTIQLSLLFMGSEFQGASLIINNTGGSRVEPETYFITRRGLLHIQKGTASGSLEQRPVSLSKLVHALVNKEALPEPMKLNALFSEMTTPLV